MKRKFDKLMQSYQLAVSTKALSSPSKPSKHLADKQALLRQGGLKTALKLHNLRTELSDLQGDVAAAMAAAVNDISQARDYIKAHCPRQRRPEDCARVVLDEVLDALAAAGLVTHAEVLESIKLLASSGRESGYSTRALLLDHLSSRPTCVLFNFRTYNQIYHFNTLNNNK
jgi:hypothetical protein